MSWAFGPTSRLMPSLEAADRREPMPHGGRQEPPLWRSWTWPRCMTSPPTTSLWPMKPWAWFSPAEDRASWKRASRPWGGKLPANPSGGAAQHQPPRRFRPAARSRGRSARMATGPRAPGRGRPHGPGPRPERRRWARRRRQLRRHPGEGLAMPRRVAITGVGLTRCSSWRRDVSYPELVYEAVSAALQGRHRPGGRGGRGVRLHGPLRRPQRPRALVRRCLRGGGSTSLYSRSALGALPAARRPWAATTTSPRACSMSSWWCAPSAWGRRWTLSGC